MILVFIRSSNSFLIKLNNRIVEVSHTPYIQIVEYRVRKEGF